jgi:hypothetical protein
LKDNEIELLKKIIEGVDNKKELQKSLGIQVWQTNYLINELIKKDYLEVAEKKLELKRNAKTILFREVSKKYDIKKLLHDSNETIFTSLNQSQITPATIDSLSKETLCLNLLSINQLTNLNQLG